MGQNKLDEEDLRKYVNCKVHLKLSSEGIEPSTLKSLSETSNFIGVSRQTLEYTNKHKKPLITRWKGGAKYSSLSGLSRHNIYPSWINIFWLFKNYQNFLQVKMPHSNFKGRSRLLNSGVGKCPCGKIFNYVSEMDQKMKFQLHHKFCSKLPEGSRQIRTPKKAMTLREQQHHMAERMRKVHEHH